MLTSLQGYGVSQEIVIRNSDFVEGFWKGVEAIGAIESQKHEGMSRNTHPGHHLYLSTLAVSTHMETPRRANVISAF